MKRKKAGLYDPYLDTLGGGEKHIVSVLEVLDKKGYDVTLFWNEDLSKELQERSSLQFSHLSFKKNIFVNETAFATKQNILADYDIFFYVPDGSYFASAAKQTVVFCMVPDKQLYPQSLVAKLKTAPFTFIANSHYTQSWLSHWGISSEVLYPYLDDPYIHIDAESLYKKDIILSVGRFFGHLHTKQHPQVIESFKKLKKEHPSFEHYQLVLAGGVKDEDRTYFDELQQRVDGDESISLLPNIPFHRLFDLYKSSRFYWHFTGYGVDPEKHPEQVEHLGITPLEAMACGCLTMAYDAGGPRELIEHEKNGCLFKTEDELFSSMQTFHDNETKQYQMKLQAKRFIKQTFSRKQFEKRVTEVLF